MKKAKKTAGKGEAGAGIHPSWAAKLASKEKAEKQQGIQAFKGKKTTFGDDD